MMKLSSIRRIMQISVLVISNIGFTSEFKTGIICPFLYCHGCPFAFFACPIGVLQHFTALRQISIFTVGFLGVYGVVIGRAFCGWACPFGALQDFISRLRRRRSKATHYTFTKYIVLLGVVTSAWITGDTLFCKFCPSGSLFAAIPFYLLNPTYQGFGFHFYIHIITLTALLIPIFFINRFWCRYLCPLAAIYGLFNKVSLLKIKLDEKVCNECGSCLEACSMGISNIKEVEASSNCIKCGQCIEKCRKKALSLKWNL